MLEKLKEYIAAKGLFEPTDRLLLAVSGGIDSMVMLHLFQQLPYKLAVAHVNFKLRGEESDADEQFLRDYCQSQSIELFVKHADTISYSENNKVSIQMAAREIRYAWFKDLKQSKGFSKVLVAQHTDDSIETTFINIIRGTGIAGLKGIISNEHASRPLMCFSRAEIDQFAKQNNIKWREDSSNAKNDYLRNNLRNKILPLLDEISDSWRNNIVQLNKDIEETELILSKYYSEHVDKIFRNNLINVEGVQKLTSGKWLLRKLLVTLGFTHDTITDILENLNVQIGRTFESEKVLLRKQRDGFSVEERGIVSKYIEETINLDDHEITIKDCTILIQKLNGFSPDFKFEKSSKYLDLEKLEFPLKIRTWQVGDWFIPLGMKGKKKLSDYFVDKKFTFQQKENTFVIVSEGNIVCILGHQTDERYKLSEHTKRILHLRIKNG
jgi:tRNA(Ile)-lysidine synthase